MVCVGQNSSAYNHFLIFFSNFFSRLLTYCRIFVLDEVDGLLQPGQGEIINRLHSRAPKITTDEKRLTRINCFPTLHSFEVKIMLVYNLKQCGIKEILKFFFGLGLSYAFSNLDPLKGRGFCSRNNAPWRACRKKQKRK
jgi:hypothetical protein